MRELEFQRENGEKLNKQHEALSSEIEALQKVAVDKQKSGLNKIFNKYKWVRVERQKELLEDNYK